MPGEEVPGDGIYKRTITLGALDSFTSSFTKSEPDLTYASAAANHADEAYSSEHSFLSKSFLGVTKRPR